MYEEFRLPRTAETTLLVHGRKLGEVCNEPVSKRKQDNRYHRWHNLSIYETRTGKIVLAIEYRTNFLQRERGHDRAVVFNSIREALFFAKEVYNPLEFWCGPPAFGAYAAKRERYADQLKHRYAESFHRLAAQITDAIKMRETEVL